MAAWASLLQILNPIGIVDSVIGNRKHKREIKAAIKTQQLKNVEAGRIAEVEWNLASIKNSGLKDEWLTLVLSVPLIGSFIPMMVPHIHAGFTELRAMPLWYQSAVGVMIASSFGYQKVAGALTRSKMNKAYTLPIKEQIEINEH